MRWTQFFEFGWILLPHRTRSSVVDSVAVAVAVAVAVGIRVVDISLHSFRFVSFCFVSSETYMYSFFSLSFLFSSLFLSLFLHPFLSLDDCFFQWDKTSRKNPNMKLSITTSCVVFSCIVLSAALLSPGQHSAAARKTGQVKPEPPRPPHIRRTGPHNVIGTL